MFELLVSQATTGPVPCCKLRKVQRRSRSCQWANCGFPNRKYKPPLAMGKQTGFLLQYPKEKQKKRQKTGKRGASCLVTCVAPSGLVHGLQKPRSHVLTLEFPAQNWERGHEPLIVCWVSWPRPLNEMSKRPLTWGCFFWLRQS